MQEVSISARPMKDTILGSAQRLSSSSAVAGSRSNCSEAISNVTQLAWSGL